MHKIEYEIKLNENGRPYIYLPEDFEDKSEHKFFVMELTIYMLQEIYHKRINQLDQNTIDKLKQSIDVLLMVSDEAADIIKGQLETMGDVSLITNKAHHIQVKTIKERDNLNYNGIIYNNKIFKRIEGLKVLVTEDMKIYELKDGIDNKNWVEI